MCEIPMSRVRRLLGAAGGRRDGPGRRQGCPRGWTTSAGEFLSRLLLALVVPGAVLDNYEAGKLCCQCSCTSGRMVGRLREDDEVPRQHRQDEDLQPRHTSEEPAEGRIFNKPFLLAGSNVTSMQSVKLPLSPQNPQATHQGPDEADAEEGMNEYIKEVLCCQKIPAKCSHQSSISSLQPQ